MCTDFAVWRGFSGKCLSYRLESNLDPRGVLGDKENRRQKRLSVKEVLQVDAAPAFASVSEAMDMARAALGYLAGADAGPLADASLAECLRGLEQTDAILTAARASFLSVFTAGRGYSADADYSPRGWLIHKTRVSKRGAVAHPAWARRAATHPQVLAALAAGELSESYGRAICTWTG